MPACGWPFGGSVYCVFFYMVGRVFFTSCWACFCSCFQHNFSNTSVHFFGIVWGHFSALVLGEKPCTTPAARGRAGPVQFCATGELRNGALRVRRSTPRTDDVAAPTWCTRHCPSDLGPPSADRKTPCGKTYREDAVRPPACDPNSMRAERPSLRDLHLRQNALTTLRRAFPCALHHATPPHHTCTTGSGHNRGAQHA